MSKVKIKILSPVHIGNGNFLRYNTDFVAYRAQGEEYSSLYVVDPKKILDLIGEDKIDYWVSAIERNEKTTELVSRLGIGATPDMYALRKLDNYVEFVKDSDTLKECMHNGLGFPYIPGSSIKGAIRSVVLATLAEDVANKEDMFRDERTGRINVSAKPLETKVFGKDPNADWFRFIKVGDAYFEEESLIATRAVSLNITSKDSLKDDKTPQIVEAITLDYESELQMKVDRDYYDRIAHKEQNKSHMPSEMDSIPTLFKWINRHTQKLLQEEIEYWTSVQEEEMKKGADEYIDNLTNLLNQSKQCKKGLECVLRLGYGIGWRFITGAWAESLSNFERDIVPKARPNNEHYQDYVFPKTRRLDEGNDVFGFVKLTIKE